MAYFEPDGKTYCEWKAAEMAHEFDLEHALFEQWERRGLRLCLR